MTMNINGHNAQGEALPKFGKHSRNALQIKANFDAWACNEQMAVLTGGEG